MKKVLLSAMLLCGAMGVNAATSVPAPELAKGELVKEAVSPSGFCPIKIKLFKGKVKVKVCLEVEME